MTYCTFCGHWFSYGCDWERAWQSIPRSWTVDILVMPMLRLYHFKFLLSRDTIVGPEKIERLCTGKAPMLGGDNTMHPEHINPPVWMSRCCLTGITSRSPTPTLFVTWLSSWLPHTLIIACTLCTTSKPKHHVSSADDSAPPLLIQPPACTCWCTMDATACPTECPSSGSACKPSLSLNFVCRGSSDVTAQTEVEVCCCETFQRGFS